MLKHVAWALLLAWGGRAGAEGGWAGANEPISADSVTDEHVTAAIRAIVDELYERKDRSQFWEPAGLAAGESRQVGGYTAISVLALLYAGESYQDERLRDAVAYLEGVEMDGTYAVAVRTSVWAKLPPRFEDLLARDTKWLLDGFSERAAGWNYRQEPNTTRRDNSITQYGALALWDAARRGVRVDPRIWRRLEEGFLDSQLADGGWNYTGDGPASGSMTAAGLATLFITLDFLHANESVDLRGPAPTASEAAIERGLAWMNENFSAEDNPGTFRDFYYYLYGVERVGLASGRKYFGAHDWFREGAAELLRRLCAWDPETRTMRVHATTAGSARGGNVRTRHLVFALMFLCRGRVPVAINKLAFDGAWNNRPRDVANAVRWIAESAETELAWQIVDLGADPEDWLDAPILYAASSSAPAWLAGDGSSPELARLRRYLDLGGLLVAVNEGAGRQFASAVELAGSAIYPEHEWRALPDGHWAYTIVNPVGDRRPALRALGNGVRDLIIVAAENDLARTFQSRDEKAVSQFETIANVYHYASEKNRPRPRLDLHAAAAPDRAGLARATIVRAVYDGSWRPEPLALDVFADDAAARGAFDLTIVDHPLGRLTEIDPPPALVVVSGIDGHSFTAAEIASVEACAASGGVILFETTGGRGDFTLSAEEALSTALERPIRSALRAEAISGEGLEGAHRLTRLDYRPFSFEVFGTRETTPRLRAMQIDGERRIFFSRDDIGHALLGQPCWGISGYTPDSARRLMENLVRWGGSG